MAALILVDANVLLYAYFPESPHHPRCRAWIEATLSGAVPVRLSWLTILAFARIATAPRVFRRPFGIDEAATIVSTWLRRSSVAVLEPGERYWPILRELLVSAQVTGPLVMDAALAALAIEHGATLCTTDADFRRFPGLRTVSPLAQ